MKTISILVLVMMIMLTIPCYADDTEATGSANWSKSTPCPYINSMREKWGQHSHEIHTGRIPLRLGFDVCYMIDKDFGIEAQPRWDVNNGNGFELDLVGKIRFGK